MKTKHTAPSIKKKRILIVEDDPGVMNVLSSMLQSGGYDVTEASYSLPALFRVVRDKPDLILVDLGLPVMGGLELIEQFRSHRETRNVPIAVVTGKDTDEARAFAKKAGCVGFIAKPVDLGHFLQQVAVFLSFSAPKKDDEKRLPDAPAGKSGRGVSARGRGGSFA
jgi:CheY-like chemotaxis protein